MLFVSLLVINILSLYCLFISIAFKFMDFNPTYFPNRTKVNNNFLSVGIRVIGVQGRNECLC